MIKLIILAQIVALSLLALLMIIRPSQGEDKQLCHIEPGNSDWHYRTQILPKPELKCWYDGPRMMSRSKLYWAETPSSPLPNMIVPNAIWQQEYRWTDPVGQ